MSRIKANILLAAIVALVMSGCCARPSPQKPCPPFVSQRCQIHVPEKQMGAGVEYDFAAVPGYEDARRSLFDQLATGSTAMNLQEVICLAVRNSELADLIEAERHALQCQSNYCRDTTLDLILQGEALEQRNKAAGAAAELFLGLVQVQMQRELIEETKLHLAELEETNQAAAKAGFATADGKNELAKGQIRLKTAQSELFEGEQKLLYQLNLLINIDDEKLVFVHPVYRLNPTSLELDVREQASLAELNRPGIRALENVMCDTGEIESIYDLLSQFDPRLGIRLAPPSIKRRLLRVQLKEKLARDEQPDNTSSTRMIQVQKILDAKKKQARIEASEAALKIQSSLEKLSIINEDIDRLNSKGLQLKGKQEIDAENAYLEVNRNWIELQEAKSNRVAAAIEYETAKIKLLQAQGQLAQMCGYDLTSTCGSACSNCE